MAATTGDIMDDVMWKSSIAKKGGGVIRAADSTV
jgi:hypothetical protein